MTKRTCSLPDCGRVHKGRGLCAMHLRRLKVHGDTQVSRPARRKYVPGELCQVPACGRQARASGFCSMHYKRKTERSRWNPGLVCAPAPQDGLCTVGGCDKPHDARGFCSGHYQRWQKSGATGNEPLSRLKRERIFNSSGYALVWVVGRGYVMEHRVVMERAIGRRLLPRENVHHINGDKADNRLSNLELWTRSQPSGQRVTDKVAWAIELLELYAPHVLSAKPTQLRLA